MMDGGEAFRIAHIDHVEGGQIAVSGRAYCDLRIGDTLEGPLVRSNETEQAAEFTIVGISTYGRTVQSLGRMLTGVLLLRGHGGQAPPATMLLIKKESSQDRAVAHRNRHRAGERR